MVNKVTFLGFRGGDRPRLHPPLAARDAFWEISYDQH